MNILYGFYQADRGSIRVAGRECRIESPEDAIAAGIGMVHQHFMLVEPFTVLENLLLGAEGGATLAAGASRARAEIAQARARICPRGRSRCGGARPSGGPPATGRDPEGAVSRRKGAGPGRADRRADAAGSRPSVPHPAQPARPGPHGRAHHPQAARDHGGDRQCLGHAPGRDGGAPAHRRDFDRGAGRAHGRPQGPAPGREGPREPRPANPRGGGPRRARRRRRHPGQRHQLRRPRRRDRRHRRGGRQRPVGAAGGAERHPAVRGRAASRSRADRSATPASAAPPASGMCRRTGCAWA